MNALVDRFGRVHTSLRISVTDRCNIRCFYCMPEFVRFKPREELLTFEEITRFVSAVSRAGINKLRITGGEPLLRAELPELIRSLVQIPSIQDVALTTNGLLLEQQAAELRRAGLQRLNISLDTLDADKFERIARRKGLEQVLVGIREAKLAGFDQLRLNAIAIKGLSEPEILPLIDFAVQHRLHLRFIEFMPLDADENWSLDNVLTGPQIRQTLEDHFGVLEAAQRSDPSQPARDYLLPGGGKVGFINSVTEPFCGSCNRLRITAEGQIRNCLFSDAEWDARALLRGEASDAELIELVRDAVAAKRRGHGQDDLEFLRPERAMYQIGG